MLARQRVDRINPACAVDQPASDDQLVETASSGPGVVADSNYSAGEVAAVAVVGGAHSLAEQWILFKMEVELETGTGGEHRPPATVPLPSSPGQRARRGASQHTSPSSTANGAQGGAAAAVRALRQAQGTHRRPGERGSPRAGPPK